MDWDSEVSIKGNPDSEEDNQQSQNTSIDQEELTSLDISRDSLDSDVDEKCDKVGISSVKPTTFKSVLLAKKRLQAYSLVKLAKKVPKAEKKDECEKKEATPKKVKKELQPMDRAKAVIEEIEEIKRKELKEEIVKQEIMAASVKIFEVGNRRSRSRSISPGSDRKFRRREIKSRNYRRADSTGRKSLSPDIHKKSSKKSPPKTVYPENWLAYEQQNMTVKKDIEMKMKLFPTRKIHPYDLFTRFHNFYTPSPLIEPFKYLSVTGDSRETPVSFLRYTRSRPIISYNVNFKTIKESCPSRAQLFSIIPSDRRQILEKFYTTSRSYQSSKKMKTRNWYSKSWKTKSDAECKVLENSVGLSFLQTYSDREDEDNETEEIVICSSTQTKKDISKPDTSFSFNDDKKTIPAKVKSSKQVFDVFDIEELPNEIDKSEESSPSDHILLKSPETMHIANETIKYENTNSRDENLRGSFTPESKENDNRDKIKAINETKKAIQQLELELKRRQAIADKVKMEEPTVFKKKRKAKQNEHSESQEGVTPNRKKKKKKIKHKRHTSESEDSSHSEESENVRKKYKKSKQKNKDKKSKRKRVSKKEGRTKTQERAEFDMKHAEKQKKKKVDTNSSESKDENESLRKSTRKYKNKKRSEEIKKKEIKIKKDAKDSEDHTTDWEHEEIVQEIAKETPENLDDHKEIRISRSNTVSTREDPFHLELNIDQRYLKRNNMLDLEGTRLSDNILCLPKIVDIKKEPEWDYDFEKNYKPPSVDEANQEIIPAEKDIIISSSFCKSTKLNNSWESEDEEIFVRAEPIPETIITRSKEDNTFDLEIPLNIKPFKKREIIDISSQKSPVEIRTVDDKLQKIEINSDLNIFNDNTNNFTLKRTGSHDIINEESKKGRWDRRKIDELDSFNLKQDVKNNDTHDFNIESSVLENEYEEFMKAVTSNISDSNDTPKNISNSSSTFSDVRTPPLKNDNNIITSQNLINESSLKIDTTINMAQPSIILPKDIPFIPMPSESNNIPLTDIKPIPVPSPMVKVEESLNSLLNLQTPSTTLSPQIIKEIEYVNENFIENKDYIEHKTDTEISSTMLKSMFNESCSKEDDIERSYTETEIAAFPSYSLETQRYIDFVSSKNIESTIDDASSMSFNVNVSSFSEEKHEEEEEKKDKPFTFMGMTLTKKNTLDKSKVKLYDSDDDDNGVENMSLPKVESISGKIENKDNIPEKISDVIEKRRDLSEISSSEIKTAYKNRSRSPPVAKDSSRSLKEKSTKDRRDISPRRSQCRRSSPSRNKIISPHKKRETSPRRHGSPRRRSPDRRYSSRSNISPRRNRNSISPRKWEQRSISPRNRVAGSPRRRSPARRRSISPRRRNSSPRRRSISPRRRNLSPRKRISSPRRSFSPKERSYKSSIRRSNSPRRKRNLSPPRERDSSPHGKRRRSISPDIRKAFNSPHITSVSDITIPLPPPSMVDQQKSPINSPLERPKQSVADSTISDDLLPQPNTSFEEYNDSPISNFQHRVSKTMDSPKRIPLDIRINQVLGVKPEEKANINNSGFQTYNNNLQQESIYYQHHLASNTMDAMSNNLYSNIETIGGPRSTNTFVQVGNMVQIVPTETPIKIDSAAATTAFAHQNTETTNMMPEYSKSTVVQVGNMLQIVPTSIPTQIPTQTLPQISPVKVEPKEEFRVLDKQSSETQMKLKAAESRAEKERRRKEREARRSDKEKKRKERERRRQIKLKQKTEDMIKRALQMEVEGIEEETETPSAETPVQWPPLSIVPLVTKEAGKSILVPVGIRDPTKSDKRKMVQFADGIKPGEGTSPSGGEELMSPPPARKLPKEKRFKKTKLFKTQKKKVKVKIIKKISPKAEIDTDDDDEEFDHLPPPSPPPGSPPPHIFPPRLKIHIINNVHPTYLPNLVPPPPPGGGGGVGGHQPQQQQIYGPPPPMNLMIHPNSIPSSSAMVMATAPPPPPHVSLTSAPPPLPPPPATSIHHHHHHHGGSSTGGSGTNAMLHQGALHHHNSSMSHHSVTAPGPHGISHQHGNYHF